MPQRIQNIVYVLIVLMHYLFVDTLLLCPKTIIHWWKLLFCFVLFDGYTLIIVRLIISPF